MTDDCLIEPSRTAVSSTSKTSSCYPVAVRRRLAEKLPHKIRVDMSDHAIRDALTPMVNVTGARPAASTTTSLSYPQLQHLALDFVKPKPNATEGLTNANLFHQLHYYFRKHADRATFHRISIRRRVPYAPPSSMTTTEPPGHAFIVFTQGHWVAAWQDTARHLYYYFDSEADAKRTPDRVRRAMRAARRDGYAVHRNHKAFQRRPGECGCFVLYFLLYCLSGRDPLEFDRRRSDAARFVNDQQMKRFRKSVFASK